MNGVGTQHERPGGQAGPLKLFKIFEIVGDECYEALAHPLLTRGRGDARHGPRTNFQTGVGSHARSNLSPACTPTNPRSHRGNCSPVRFGIPTRGVLTYFGAGATDTVIATVIMVTGEARS
jgi:hypothetical protein